MKFSAGVGKCELFKIFNQSVAFASRTTYHFLISALYLARTGCWATSQRLCRVLERPQFSHFDAAPPMVRPLRLPKGPPSRGFHPYAPPHRRVLLARHLLRLHRLASYNSRWP